MVFHFIIQAADKPGPDPMDRLVGTFLASLFPVSGILAGVIALFGMIRHGRKGILLPALIGLVLWGALFALTIPTYQKIQKRALELKGKPTAQTPPVTTPGATRLEDGPLRFSFDLPEGFTAMPSKNIPPGYKHAFGCQLPDEPTRLLLVRDLGGAIPRQRLKAAHLPPGTPTKSSTLAAFDWRGIEIDALRVLETSGELKYLTYQIQVPLRGRAIQLAFGGALEKEESIQETARQVLASLEGESNW